MPSNQLFQTQALTIGYKQQPVIANLNLEIPTGKVIALIGKNGCGKSTLLKTLAGIIPPLSGTILMNNCPTQKMGTHDFSKFVSYVATHGNLNGSMTVMDMIALGRFPFTNWLHKLTSEDILSINKAVTLMNLEPLKHKTITHLSDGERQRVLIARALAQDTPFMLLDEPTAFLDIPNKYELLENMRIIAENERKSFLISIHDINLSLKKCDEIWFIHQNKIIQFNQHQTTEDAIVNMMMK